MLTWPFRHHCLLHGELREVPGDTWKVDDEDNEDDEDDDDDDDEDSEDFPEPAHLQDDSDIEKVINYKLLANPDAFNVCAESEMITPKGKIPPSGKFNVNWWFNETFTAKWEKRRPFFPCSHEGSCESANCRCFRENINCEKTCRCSRQCNRRFPGCSCVTTPGKQACSSSACLCSKFGRECDADLCGSCGAMEVLDPVNRYNEGVIQGKCNNVAIQRGVPRKTLLGHSEVHGFGLYMGEDINKGEYIGEYTGEAISVKEGDRRGVISTYQQTMYLFKLSSSKLTYPSHLLPVANISSRTGGRCDIYG
jgi:histone-lysine N-methyltransferase EZH2